MDNRPSNTLYVNNLDDRINKEDLKRGLYYLFNQYGKVVDLLAMKSPRMRGQAFIAYRDIGHATLAMRSLQGFALFDKPMRIQFAKRDSQVVRRLKGQAPTVPADRKDENKAKRSKKITIRMLTDSESSVAAKARANGDSGDASGDANMLDEQPNKLLLLENLPEETTAEMLQMLFSQIDGFKEARCVDGRSDIAFVEYENEEQAKSALDVYRGFKIDPEHAMRITFAKK